LEGHSVIFLAIRTHLSCRGLPARVTIYRGCSPVNATGLSWSLDPAIAAKFPTHARYSPPDGQPPLLVTATVARSRIVAVKLDRDEDEVITCHARPVAFGPIEQTVD
jgi:hypothetical protein